jgi:hypothetical protein
MWKTTLDYEVKEQTPEKFVCEFLCPDGEKTYRLKIVESGKKKGHYYVDYGHLNDKENKSGTELSYRRTNKSIKYGMAVHSTVHNLTQKFIQLYEPPCCYWRTPNNLTAVKFYDKALENLKEYYSSISYKIKKEITNRYSWYYLIRKE